MKLNGLLLTMALCACGQRAEENAAQPASVPSAAVVPDAPMSKPPAVVPLPKEQAEVDRMILAGYTPHADHLHPPGVKECPLSQGSEAVM